MGMKENQKKISVILDEDVYDEWNKISHIESRSMNQFCCKVIKGLIDNPEILAGLQAKIAEKEYKERCSNFYKYRLNIEDSTNVSSDDDQDELTSIFQLV